MDLITTHLNADFDAMASMIAAKKLYPSAHLVFPGSQERNLREFFLKSTLVSFPFERLRDIDLDAVTRLILVDINIPGRLGPLDEVASRDGMELHIFDHHPRTANDYRGEVEHIEQVGATTTIMVEIIRKRRMKITPEEATIMALGIYEDTGSLTFASTTARDLNAVSWLLKKGAHLEIIPTFIAHELDAQQVQLLNELLTSMRTVNVHGIPVAVTSASTDMYIGELALLVHKIMDMENLDALFTIVRMEDRIILVARSRLPELDVSRVAGEFGGGGHPTAASASIRELTLVQVEDKLGTLLEKMVGERINAGTIMSSPVMDMKGTEPIATAAEIMSRFNINSLPVVSRTKLVGIITRGVVERAILHGLSDSPVKEYMLTEYSTVGPASSLAKVQEQIIEKRQRMLPVIADKKLVGVITRTDLLEAMHDDFKRTRAFEDTSPDEDTPGARVRNIGELIREILEPRAMRILTAAGEAASELDDRAYLVGGLVRDLVLRKKNMDIDLVVEGDAIQFARLLARKLKGRTRSHKKFKTAVVILKDEFKLDVATARTEYYKAPGAHPMVERGSIKLDLYRRDFSINALAVRLNPEGFGQVVDFFGGLRDLKDRTVRILHNLSFVDDPTRIIRAVRFEQKFEFRIGKHTEYLLKGAVRKGYLRQAQGPRVHNELLIILRGEKPSGAFQRMQELGILESLHPSLSFAEKVRELFNQVERIHSWFLLLFIDEEPDIGEIYFSSIIMSMGEKERDELFETFHLSEHQRVIYRERFDRVSTVMRELSRTEEPKLSWIARQLSDVPIEELLLIMSLTKRENTARAISVYLSRLRYLNREIDGKTLQKMGYPSGPIFKEIMMAVQDARVDGIVNSVTEEKQWVSANFPLKQGKGGKSDAETRRRGDGGKNQSKPGT